MQGAVVAGARGKREESSIQRVDCYCVMILYLCHWRNADVGLGTYILNLLVDSKFP